MKFFNRDKQGYIYFSRQRLVSDIINEFVFSNGDWSDGEGYGEVKVAQVEEFVSTLMNAIGEQGIHIGREDIKNFFSSGVDVEFDLKDDET